jgi:hypothetical protein
MRKRSTRLLLDFVLDFVGQTAHDGVLGYYWTLYIRVKNSSQSCMLPAAPYCCFSNKSQQLISIGCRKRGIRTHARSQSSNLCAADLKLSAGGIAVQSCGQITVGHGSMQPRRWNFGPASASAQQMLDIHRWTYDMLNVPTYFGLKSCLF